MMVSEVAHTALAYWQAGRRKKAYDLYRGAIVDAMSCSTVPGACQGTSEHSRRNAGVASDFSCSVAMFGRALVEGLFGIVPDALEGEFEVGMLLMYLFFVVVGAGTDAISFIATAFNLFLYGMLIITIHLALVLLGARLLKIDLAEALVASGAALVGPAVTAAIATSKGWNHLVTPGIMCGIFGIKFLVRSNLNPYHTFNKIKHRGPDHSDIISVNNQNVFGFHRSC